MSIRLLLAALVLLVLAPVASAASFDCSKASSPFEKAICADEALSHSDDVLAVAWKTANGGLSKAAGDVMLKGQRDWLGFLDKVCADDMLPGQDAAETERIACLSSQYTTRIRALEGSRMLGGLRFYLVNSYWAAPDPDGESYYRVATATSVAPMLDADSGEAKAFNTIMADQAQQRARMLDMSEESGEAAKEPSTSADTDLTMTVSNVNDARIDVDVMGYWYGHGAAHGNYAVNYLHFLRGEGRLLEATDLFAGKEWNDRLAELTLARLKADRGELLWDIEGDWLKEAVADPSRWKFSDGGLAIQFQPYEVASYAEGAVTAEVPWIQLQDYLSDTGSALTYN